MIITPTAIIPVENISSIYQNTYTNDIMYYVKGQDEVFKEHFASKAEMAKRFHELIITMQEKRGK